MYKDKKANYPQKWIILSAAFGLCGLLVSMFLVKEHFRGDDDGSGMCEISSRVSCTVVLKSSWATLFSIPLAFLGITWNIIHLALTYQIYETYETKDVSTWITSHFIWSLSGIGFVFYLLFAELVLGALCPACTIIHIITVGLFWISWNIYKQQTSGRPTARSLLIGTHRWIIVIALVHLLILVYFNFPQNPPQNPATVDDFAQCLTNSQIVMYGSPRCGHCSHQMKIFGDAFKSVNFVNCDESPLCKENNVKGYPTWIKFKDDQEVVRSVGVMPLEGLAEWSKTCQYITPTI